ncbi:MAG: CYTH domain-containing protein, partial [Bacteroidales bacterium]|nr:CYTH domain-containing protein [Bacteroidales bacterium]
MPLEIERKFLVSGDFMPEVFQSDHIVQGYLNSSSERTVRVRVRNDAGYITIKSPSFDGGLSRFEWEMEIPVEDARKLLALAEPTVID